MIFEKTKYFFNKKEANVDDRPGSNNPQKQDLLHLLRPFWNI
jgi:hypothetical protein